MRLLSTALLFTAAFAATAATPTTLTVSGEYYYYTDDMTQFITGDFVCFSPDVKGQTAILKSLKVSAKQYGHDVRFCFENSTFAAKQFGFELSEVPNTCGVKGKATVAISNYVRYMEEGDGEDFATLVSVTQKSAISPIKC